MESRLENMTREEVVRSAKELARKLKAEWAKESVADLNSRIDPDKQAITEKFTAFEGVLQNPEYPSNEPGRLDMESMLTDWNDFMQKQEHAFFYGKAGTDPVSLNYLSEVGIGLIDRNKKTP